MLEIFHIVRQFPRRDAVWRNFVLAFMLLLSLVGAGQATPVQAFAPEQQKRKLTITIWLDFTMPPAPICVGQAYSINVKTNVDEDYILKNGKADHQRGGPQTSVKVEASSKAPAVGTISPAALLSGWDVDADPALAAFDFTARKEGSTILTFKATWKGTSLVQKKPVQVVNCRYKVSAVTNAGASYPNLHSQLLSKLVGEMKSEDGKTFSGTASVDWSAFSFSQRCSHSHTFSPAQAQLSGTRVGNQLVVQVTYEPASFSSQSCASSNSGQLAAPMLTATLPSSGGRWYGRYSLPWGVEAMKGSATVIVTPIENK